MRHLLLALPALVALAGPAGALDMRFSPNPGNLPGALQDDTLAINRADGRLYYRRSDGSLGGATLLDALASGRRAVERGQADDLTVTAPGAGMVGRGLADRAGDRRSVADASSAACGGTTDATAAVNAAAAASALGTQVLVVNCPLTLARPDLVAIPSSVHLAFEGRGRLTWNFGALTAVRLDSPGRAYASLPTASIAGNAALGAVSMRLYEPSVAAGGTGYAVGNTLALVGGTGTAPTLTVTAIGPGGAVTGVSIADGGSLTALPTGSIATTGGAGSGARVTATWSVASIAVASGGSYASAAVPAITLSGGSPAVPAVATAVGRQLYVSGAITAAPEQQIFGGYARLAGGPNAGRLRAAWFGAGTFNSDNSPAIQAGIDSAIALEFGPGFYQACAPLTAKPNLKLIGPASTGATMAARRSSGRRSGAPAAGRTCSAGRAARTTRASRSRVSRSRPAVRRPTSGPSISTSWQAASGSTSRSRTTGPRLRAAGCISATKIPPRTLRSNTRRRGSTACTTG